MSDPSPPFGHKQVTVWVVDDDSFRLLEDGPRTVTGNLNQSGYVITPARWLKLGVQCFLTEQEAADAGQCWVERELRRMEIETERLHRAQRALEIWASRIPKPKRKEGTDGK
jgi:hypothetical protein